MPIAASTYLARNMAFLIKAIGDAKGKYDFLEFMER